LKFGRSVLTAERSLMCIVFFSLLLVRIVVIYGTSVLFSDIQTRVLFDRYRDNPVHGDHMGPPHLIADRVRIALLRCE
jgi:hypothetical protein